jgi:hypothetical protein
VDTKYRHNFLNLVATYSPRGILPNRIYLVQVNKYALPLPWTNWTPSLLLGPLANLFVIWVAYYFLFVLGWSDEIPNGWQQRIVLDIPWVFISLTVFLFWRDAYASLLLWKANKLGLISKKLPLRINF